MSKKINILSFLIVNIYVMFGKLNQLKIIFIFSYILSRINKKLLKKKKKKKIKKKKKKVKYITISN